MSNTAAPKFTIEEKVWLYPGVKAAWHFISIPSNVSQEVRQLFTGRIHSFGSLPVMVTIGKTSWKTSVFWSTKTKQYILPLKAEVRKKETIEIGKETLVQIEFIL